MGFVDGLKKNFDNIVSSVRNNVSGALQGLNNYKESVLKRVRPEQTPSRLEELSEEDFDKLARERGYRKVDAGYQERTPMAEEDRARRIEYEDGEDRIEDYEVKPLTPEQKARLDVLYYGVYTVVEEYTTTSSSGVTTTSRPKPPFTKQTITVGDIRSVKGLIRDDIYSAPKGRSDSIILIEYTIYRIIRDTGETEVVETGADI